jgi:hypothetical protein
MKEWPYRNSMLPIDIQDITLLEKKISATLPRPYKYLLKTYGLLRTPNVLTKTCDLSVKIDLVKDFLSLEDVFSLTTLYAMTGMPSGYVVFASDSNGDMFCFLLSGCQSNEEFVEVWLYNQKASTVTKVAKSFNQWLLTL